MSGCREGLSGCHEGWCAGSDPVDARAALPSPNIYLSLFLSPIPTPIPTPIPILRVPIVRTHRLVDGPPQKLRVVREASEMASGDRRARKLVAAGGRRPKVVDAGGMGAGLVDAGGMEPKVNRRDACGRLGGACMQWQRGGCSTPLGAYLVALVRLGGRQGAWGQGAWGLGARGQGAGGGLGGPRWGRSRRRLLVGARERGARECGAREHHLQVLQVVLLLL